jgi:serine/threonine protein kinase
VQRQVDSQALGILAACQAGSIPLNFTGISIPEPSTAQLSQEDALVVKEELAGVDKRGGLDLDSRFQSHCESLSDVLGRFATVPPSGFSRSDTIPLSIFDEVLADVVDLLTLVLIPDFLDEAIASACNQNPACRVSVYPSLESLEEHLHLALLHKSGSLQSQLSSFVGEDVLLRVYGPECPDHKVIIESELDGMFYVAQASREEDLDDAAVATDRVDDGAMAVMAGSNSLPRVSLPVNSAMFDCCGIIGSGSYGRVEVWRKKDTGTYFAVKSMNKKALKVRSSIRAALRELYCTTAVTSPFVCTIDYAFESEEEVHFAMRMAWGGDLERLLLTSPDRRFTEEQVVFYAAQIALGLKSMHQVGMIHRDLKASNVLLDERGNVMIADLGLAVVLHSCSDGRGNKIHKLSSTQGIHESVTADTPGLVPIPPHLKPGCPGAMLSRMLDRIADGRGPMSVVDMSELYDSSSRKAPHLMSVEVGAMSPMAAASSGRMSRGATAGDEIDPVGTPAGARAGKSKLNSVKLDAGERLGLGVEASLPVYERWYKGKAGTPAYWAPELLRVRYRTRRRADGREVREESRLPYGVGADWFSFGCLVYALFTGRSPFATGRGAEMDNEETLNGISDEMFFPDIFSPIATDFLMKLLHPEPSSRLGGGPDGFTEVMSHPFFRFIDWNLLEARAIPPPITPPYRMRVDLARVPNKVRNHDAHAEMKEAEKRLSRLVAECVLETGDRASFKEIFHVNPRLASIEAALRIEHLTNPNALPSEASDFENVLAGGATFRPRRPSDGCLPSDVWGGAMCLRERSGAPMVFQLGSRSIAAMTTDMARDKVRLDQFIRRLRSKWHTIERAAKAAGDAPLSPPPPRLAAAGVSVVTSPPQPTGANGAGGAAAAAPKDELSSTPHGAVASSVAADSQVGAVLIDDTSVNPTPRGTHRPSVSGEDSATKPATDPSTPPVKTVVPGRPFPAVMRMASVARHDNAALGVGPAVPAEMREFRQEHLDKFRDRAFHLDSEDILERPNMMSVMPAQQGAGWKGGKFNSMMSMSMGLQQSTSTSSLVSPMKTPVGHEGFGSSSKEVDGTVKVASGRTTSQRARMAQSSVDNDDEVDQQRPARSRRDPIRDSGLRTVKEEEADVSDLTYADEKSVPRGGGAVTGRAKPAGDDVEMYHRTPADQEGSRVAFGREQNPVVVREHERGSGVHAARASAPAGGCHCTVA